MPQTNHNTQVAIYARVSTRDKQDVQNQLGELRQWTKKMGYKIYQRLMKRFKFPGLPPQFLPERQNLGTNSR